MNIIYFDNSATAIPNPKAYEAFASASGMYANPSSLHAFGLETRKMLEKARADVASAFCCSLDEMTFTSSGTEANNIAVISSARKNRHAGNVIVTTKAEHPSVTETVRFLEKEGFRAVYVPVTGGTVDYDALADILSTEKVCLVSLMQANNQNGAVTDLKKVRDVIAATGSKALFHSDCVQGFMKVPDSMRAYAARYCDTASVSAHKVGGFKGTGALFVRKGLVLSPVIFGGGQERGLRSGTENVAGICAFAEAAKAFDDSCRAKITRLRELFIEKASSELGSSIDFRIPETHIDALLNISIKNVKSEVALNYLSGRGVCVSSSSACSSKAKENTVLASFGYGKDYEISSLRIGFSPFNTEEEVEILVNELANASAFRMKGK